MKRFFVYVLMLFSIVVPAANVTESVSIINLISTPEKYEGKKIRVVGIAKIEFEGNAIYLSKQDLENAYYKNGLWLTLNSEEMSKFKKFSGKSVLVEGIFRSKKKGHLGLWSGSLNEISRVEEYPKSKQ